MLGASVCFVTIPQEELGGTDGLPGFPFLYNPKAIAAGTMLSAYEDQASITISKKLAEQRKQDAGFFKLLGSVMLLAVLLTRRGAQARPGPGYCAGAVGSRKQQKRPRSGRRPRSGTRNARR